MTPTARSGSGTGPTGQARRLVVSVLAAGVVGSGCATARIDLSDLAGLTLEPHEVVTGTAHRQTVVTGHLLGGDVAEVAVVNVDENDARRVRVYAYGVVPEPSLVGDAEFVMRVADDFGDGVWVPVVDAPLGSEVVFVDVANIGGRDRLVTYEPGRLNWFDPESATDRELVGVTSDYDPPPGRPLPHVDITRDLNGDGRDDLVVPDADGFRVFIQLSDGTFAEPVSIGAASRVERIYGADGYRYDPWASGRIHEMDYDRDGRGDLVCWNEDHFDVHLQDERGLFSAAATTFTTEVEFDCDELAALAIPDEVRNRRHDHALTRALSGRVLHSLADVNGDGVADLVVFTLGGRSLLKLHSSYEVHVGAPSSDGGVVFPPEAVTAINWDGITFDMHRHDFDHDGQVDMMFTRINPSRLKIVGMLVSALLTGSVPLDLEFYRLDEGVYPETPNASRKIRADIPSEPSHDHTFFPAVLVVDVNGDGHSELLVGNGREEMHVFVGVPGPDLFARRPQRVSFAMPEDEEYTWLVDLNRDGKQDILMHYPSATEPHRVTMLIAR